MRNRDKEQWVSIGNGLELEGGSSLTFGELHASSQIEGSCSSRSLSIYEIALY